YPCKIPEIRILEGAQTERDLCNDDQAKHERKHGKSGFHQKADRGGGTQSGHRPLLSTRADGRGTPLCRCWSQTWQRRHHRGLNECRTNTVRIMIPLSKGSIKSGSEDIWVLSGW